MRLDSLRQRQKDLVTEGKTLAQLGEQRTPEQATRYAAITAEHGDLDKTAADIAAAEKLIATEKAMILADDARVAVVHDRAVDKPWGSFGLFLQSVQHAHSGSGIDVRLSAAATGMGEQVGPDGGYAIPKVYADGIEKMMWESGQVLSRVSDRPVSGNVMVFNVIDERSRVDGSRRGGVLGYWTDEGGTPTATQVKLAQVEMKLRKVAALGYMTEELMQDAPTLDAELTSAFAEELLFLVEDAIINGAGVVKPLGVLNAPCLVSVSKETNQAAASIYTTNLSKMWARLPARSKAGAVWFINVDVEPQLDELTIPAGTAAVQPRFVNYGPTGILTIKGRPVIPIEFAASVGTVGDIILGDFSQYRLIRKDSGVQQASSIHVRFTSGENTFRAIYRVDGQPLPRTAITPKNGANTLSPFVVLATRS
jgi:HK97 family phage major capsid protein